MRTLRRWAMLSLAALALPVAMQAQGMPTASRTMVFSGFGMGTGNWTNILMSRNIGITAGVAVEFPRVFGLHPEIELRATYPIDSGNIVGQKNILGGVKFGRPIGSNLHLYGDFLYGRGEMTYQHGGFPVGSVLYLKSSSGIYSFGGGAEYDISAHYALKADYQYQVWKTPVLTSGTAHPQMASAGLVYRFNVSRFPSGEKRKKEKKRQEPPPTTVTVPAPQAAPANVPAPPSASPVP